MVAGQYKLQIEQHRKAARKHEETERNKNAYRVKIEKKESSENQSILETVINTQAENLRQAPHVATVSSGSIKQVTLSDKRITSYRSHVETIIEQAFSGQLPKGIPDHAKNDAVKSAVVTRKIENNPALSVLNEQVCGICKGDCCKEGGNEAYLTVFTIKRVRESQPDLSAGEIFNEYLSRVSNITIGNSCINHTESGCALPRQLRSDTCNNFFCDELGNLVDKFENEPSKAPVLLIKRSNNYWNRFDNTFENNITDVVLINEDDIQTIDIRLIKN